MISNNDLILYNENHFKNPVMDYVIFGMYIPTTHILVSVFMEIG